MPIDRFILQNNLHKTCEKIGMQEHAIIDSIDGRCMVVAPPGKNIIQLFSLRIGKSLLQPGQDNASVLCITSTESAAKAIQQQLEALTETILPQMHILTLEAFFKQLLLNLPPLNDQSIQPITTVEHIKLLQDIISNLPKGNPLKKYRGDVFSELTNLKNVFSAIKKNGLDVESLQQRIDSILNKLVANEDSATDVAGKNEDLPEALTNLRASVNEFSNYQRLLHACNRYDKDDLVDMLTKAYEQTNELFCSYLQQYKYIQVDVAEAIYKRAIKLLHLVFCTHPNLLFVDDRQDDFWPASKLPFGYQTVVLNAISDLTMTQQAISLYHSTKEEVAATTNKVSHLIRQAIDPQKIAVIYKDAAVCKSLEAHFKIQHIPFSSDRNINILQAPFIKKIIQILRYISHEQRLSYHGDELLFEILHFDFFQVPPLAIAQLAIEVNSQKKIAATTMRKLLQKKIFAPPKDLFDTGPDECLAAVSNVLEKLIAAVPDTPLQQLFETVLHHALIPEYVDKSSERNWLQQLLEALQKFIKTETLHNPQISLAVLVNTFDLMQKENWPVYIIASRTNKNGVDLVNATEVSIHQYDYIFITGTNTKLQTRNWLDDIQHAGDAILSSLRNSDSASQQQRLATLVIAAKAQPVSQLTISGSLQNAEETELVKSSLFASNSLTGYELSTQPIQLTESELTPYEPLQQNCRPRIAPLPIDFISSLVEKFIMNVSALNNYLDCPLGFYYKNILRISTGTNEAMEFGSAIHYALEQLFKKMAAPSLTHNEANTTRQYEFPNATELVADFSWYMQSRAAYFTHEAFNRRIQYGHEILTNYYNQYIHSWNKVVSVERNIRGIYIDGIPVRGKPDKLEFDGKSVTIVDYKTGDIQKALPKLQAPNEAIPNGGDYWRQAVFYKLLVDHYPQKDWTVTSIEFDFVEPDKTQQFRKEKIQVGPADTTTVKQQITSTWAAIQAKDFYSGCGKPNCHWCNFAKTNQLATGPSPV